MNPLDQQSKYTQDEQRRRTQAENKIHELETEVERLRKALQSIRSQTNDMDAEGLETRDIWLTAHRALGGGDTNE